MNSSDDKQDDALSGCPAETELAGRSSMCEGCPGQALCQQQSGVDPDQEFIDIRMNAILHKIIVVSGKGGVGKSTLAASLALALAQQKKRVGILDVDICGPSISQLMSVQGQKVINTQWGWKPLQSKHGKIKVMSVASLLDQAESAVVWRGPRKTQLIKQFLKNTFWGKLDYLIIDTPPGTSDEHLTVLKVLKNTRPDGAVIVTTPQTVAMDTIRKEIDFCNKMKLPILGLVENMSGFVCPCCQVWWFCVPLLPDGKCEGFCVLLF
ncbi:cytosolic Fe-S cluster assembly factor nubp1-A-like [Lytechinus pictus]|uniref:cytosolic Fe-S cluster assembly factor nubp1-A-like n=1 Tax=Lytechinus pictus TaxID=7653 RepID=UPI00240D810C|nr:cytosolic Fe-S cluster assembly factor nubp1-A-like [Lytechinus pictus]